MGQESNFDSNRRLFLATMATFAATPILGLFAEPLDAASSKDPLQGKVNRLVKGFRRKGLVSKDERTSWSVYDFSTRKKLVAINEDRPRQAASMIKPFVAQAFFYQRAKGRIGYNAKIQRLLETMIRDSNNQSTNALINLISRHSGGRGPRDVERVLKRYAPGIFQHTRIIESIPKNGRTYRNQASAHDYSRFLYAVWNNQVPYAEEMKSLLALPNRDRIQDKVAIMPERTKIYDKTGTTARLCGDMGIVEAIGRNGRRYPYTFIAIIEKPQRTRNYTQWVKQRGHVIRSVSDLVYREMKKRHRLI